MATIETNEQFTLAVNHLITQGQLSVLGERFIDRAARKVFDERGNGLENLIDITPDTATLESALDAATVTLTTAQTEAAQANSAKTTLQALMTGLHGLSAIDKGYALYCRLMAQADGASNQTIMGIIDRPTAVAYVTAKPEWIAATAATRNLLADVLETDARLCMILFLVLT